MLEQELYRLRFAHIKHERISYLGHLEMLATIQRSIRRAHLPFAVSNGFARHMRIQFSQALPVGASSLCEYFDLLLTEHMDADEALGWLKATTPFALAPYACAYKPRSVPALEAWLNHAEWELTLTTHKQDRVKFMQALDELLAVGEISYMRGDKPRTINLHDTFASFEFVETSDELLRARLISSSSPKGALRPQILIDALVKGYPELVVPYEHLHVLRTRQWHEAKDGISNPL